MPDDAGMRSALATAALLIASCSGGNETSGPGGADDSDDPDAVAAIDAQGGESSAAGECVQTHEWMQTSSNGDRWVRRRYGIIVTAPANARVWALGCHYAGRGPSPHVVPCADGATCVGEQLDPEEDCTSLIGGAFTNGTWRIDCGYEDDITIAGATTMRGGHFTTATVHVN